MENTNTKVVNNIKLVVRVLPDSSYDSLYPQMCENLITKLNNSFTSPQRFRLYPCFIYDSAIDKRKPLSSDDITIINALRDPLKTFSSSFYHNLTTNKVDLGYDKKKKSAIKNQIFKFIDRMGFEINDVNNNSYKPTIPYNVLVNNTISNIENKTQHIIMSVSDQPRIINSKQLPQDLLSEKDMSFVLIVNSTSDALQTLKKPIIEKADKNQSVKNNGAKKSRKKKGALLTEKLTIDPTSTSNITPIANNISQDNPASSTETFPENTVNIEQNPDDLQRIEAITSLKE